MGIGVVREIWGLNVKRGGVIIGIFLRPQRPKIVLLINVCELSAAWLQEEPKGAVCFDLGTSHNLVSAFAAVIVTIDTRFDRSRVL